MVWAAGSAVTADGEKWQKGHLLRSDFSGAGSLTATFTNYKRINTTLGGEGTLTVRLSDYRDIYTSLGGTGSLDYDLTNYQEINSSFSGEGTFDGRIRGQMNTSYSGEGDLDVRFGGLVDLYPEYSGGGSLEATMRRPAVTPPLWPSEESPFRITIYNRDFVRQGWLGDPESLSVEVNHNDMSDASIVVGSSNGKVPLLLERGSRVVIEYREEHLISGPIRARAARGPTSDGTMTFSVIDDWRLFHRITGWPVPAAGLGAQTSEYHTLSGPAETVLKQAVLANAVNRLGEPVTIGADLGRGENITATFRFHPLADRLFPAVDGAGIGVTVRQHGAGLLVDCYEPNLHPRLLTEAGGIVLEWQWTAAEAEATDVIVGGQGEGTARAFTGYQDPTLAAAIGERIEVFRDARDTGDGDVMNQRAAETFAETALKTGLSVKLSETSVFRYGGFGGIHVGDRVQLEVGDGLFITDTLRSATLSWTRDNGLEVVPAIGDISDNTDRIYAQALAAVAAGVRDLRRK
jgi:hypothetical protein